MATIPMGQFDAPNVSAEIRTGSPDLSGALQAGRAQEQLGNVITDTAMRAQQAHQQKVEHDKQEREALARAKAANAIASHELEVRSAVADVSEQVQTGTLDYNKAPEALDAVIGKIKAPEIADLDPAMSEAYSGGIANNANGARLMIGNTVKQARREDFKAQFSTALDTLGKIAGTPGADVAKVNAQAEAFIPLGRAAGIDPATLDKAVQDFKDRNWTNEAIGRSNAAHDDVGALTALQHELTDDKGSYVDKLDPEKRNALAAQVGGRIDTIQLRAEHAQDRADAIAEKTLAAIDQQDASGFPPTAEQMTAWAGVFKDSPHKAEFDARLSAMQETQAFLRKPIDAQMAELQRQQATMATAGADPKDVANFARRKAAVEANIKLLQDQPLLFAQNRMAQPVKGLDIQALADPSQAGAIGAQLQERAATVAALRKQYGPQVRDRLLLPQEAEMLGAVLSKMPPEQKVATFAQLRTLTGSDATYSAMMQQLAPDSPVMARAGVLASMQRRFTPDKSTVNGNVALTMLKGEQLLNKSKADKATDGAAKPFPMPTDEKMRTEFAAVVGSAFAGRPDLYEQRLQDMRAYYAGRTAEQGAITGDLDTKLLRESVTATMGRMVDFNGRTTAAPWGMAAGDFEDAAQAAMHVALHDLPADIQANTVHAAALMQVDDGLYVMVSGRNVVLDGHGKPRLVRIAR